MWTLLKLKVDEAVYSSRSFARIHANPRLFLYHLSAFVTSARSVTWHLQNQLVNTQDRATLYELLIKEMLSDPSCKFFIELRNQVEHQGYPGLRVEQVTERKAKDSADSVWYITGKCNLFDGKSDSGLDFLDKLIRTEWELTSMSGPPAHVVYQWSFPNYPTGSMEIVAACEEHVRRLWQFIYEYRMQWEAANDPGAYDRKAHAFISQDEKH